MAYSNLNYGQLFHKLDNINIKNNITSYEKIKQILYQLAMAFFLTKYV